MTDGLPLQNLLLERDGAVAVVTVNRPQVLNALSFATLDELQPHDGGARRGPDGPLHRPDRGRRQVVRGRRRHQRAGRAVAGQRPRACASRAAGLRRDREPRHAGDRGDQRLRARRRLRAGDGLHDPDRGRHRVPRPAGDQSRADSRVRRDAAPRAAHRHRPRARAAADRRSGVGRRRASGWVWSTASCRPPS